MSFGQRLKMLRIQAGYPDADSFGEAVGVTRGTVFNWEKNPKPPKAKQLDKIAKALELPLEDILRPRTWESKEVQESQMPYRRADRPMLRPMTGPPDESPRKIKREDLEAEVSYYLDRAERAGALAVAALQIRKYLSPDDFKYFDQESEPPTKETP